MEPFEKVKLARAAYRPMYFDYLPLFEKFIEMHGDRRFGDDKAIVGGIAYFEKQPVTVIGIQRGKETKEKIMRNFGCPQPEGYRKALRLMKQAEKFSRPVICFVDTSGAACAMEAEERGQGQAIAENLAEMMHLKTPILSIIIGEGGSGGALALAVANEVYMLEHSIYSVISPEGCASILFKDSSKAAEASKSLKFTSQDLLNFNVIEKIIPETAELSGAQAKVSTNVASKMDTGNEIMSETKKLIKTFLNKYKKYDGEKIAQLRYTRFRKLGYETSEVR